MATVQGDLHDICNSIVSILLRGAGYLVNDLGNDIDPQAIMDAVKKIARASAGMKVGTQTRLLPQETRGERQKGLGSGHGLVAIFEIVK